MPCEQRLRCPSVIRPLGTRAVGTEVSAERYEVRGSTNKPHQYIRCTVQQTAHAIAQRGMPFSKLRGELCSHMLPINNAHTVGMDALVLVQGIAHRAYSPTCHQESTNMLRVTRPTRFLTINYFKRHNRNNNAGGIISAIPSTVREGFISPACTASCGLRSRNRPAPLY